MIKPKFKTCLALSVAVAAIGSIAMPLAAQDAAGRPGSGAAGDNVPVLNCSNSPVNPPLVDLSTAASGWTLSNPANAVVPTASLSHVSWSAVPGAQWIGPVGGASSAAGGNWTYTRQIRINPCPKGRAAILTISYRADNGAAFTLKGPSGSTVTSASQGGTPNYGFLPGSLTNHTYTFPVGASGLHTLIFTVRNESGPSGLSAKAVFSR